MLWHMPDQQTSLSPLLHLSGVQFGDHGFRHQDAAIQFLEECEVSESVEVEEGMYCR